MPRRPAPRQLVLVALTLTLVLSGLLGVNALATARYHRSVAEGVLRDYAAFAETELENRIRVGLASKLSPVLNAIAVQMTGPGPVNWPSLADVAAEVDSSTWAIVGESLDVFAIDSTGRLMLPPGSSLSATARAQLADSLPQLAEAVFTPRAYIGLLWLWGDAAGAVAVAAPARGAARRMVGFVLPAALAGRLIAPVVSQAPLLPQTLTRGARVDSALRYRVLTPGGLLLAGDRDSLRSAFAATGVLSSTWGDLRAEVALNEAVAGLLVIGGLPRSRLPLVLVLLGLSTLLVAVAVIQLRRERELTRLREDFVTGVSHELRTPLAQIRLFAETLRLGRVRSDTERQRSLEIIDREARRLGHLVDNLLAVSQAGRGELRVSPRDTDVSQVLREAVEGFAPLAALRGAIVVLDVPDAARGVVDGDALRQIALNLLDNAVKFGPDGQTVRVRLAREGAMLHLAVEDQGPGVPSDGASRVFEPFVRLPAPGSGQTTGTGLGLSLVRDLAALHRGEARVERAAGGGARFVVELPAAGPADGGSP